MSQTRLTIDGYSQWKHYLQATCATKKKRGDYDKSISARNTEAVTDLQLSTKSESRD